MPAKVSGYKTIAEYRKNKRYIYTRISGIKALFLKTHRYRVSDFRSFSLGSHKNLTEFCPQRLSRPRYTTISGQILHAGRKMLRHRGHRNKSLA